MSSQQFDVSGGDVAILGTEHEPPAAVDNPALELGCTKRTENNHP